MVYGLPTIHEAQEACEGFAIGKQHRDSFPRKRAWRASKPLELIHSDVYGPMKTITHRGDKYFLIFVDDFSRMTWLYFLKHKSEVFYVFKKFKSMVENQKGLKIKTLRNDRGAEHTSNDKGAEYTSNDRGN